MLTEPFSVESPKLSLVQTEDVSSTSSRSTDQNISAPFHTHTREKNHHVSVGVKFPDALFTSSTRSLLSFNTWCSPDIPPVTNRAYHRNPSFRRQVSGIDFGRKTCDQSYSALPVSVIAITK